MATNTFDRLAFRWLLLSLTTQLGGVAAKTTCEYYTYFKICKTYRVNTGAVVGIVLSVVFSCIICGILTHERRKRRRAAAGEPAKKQTAPTTPGWNPPTTGAVVVSGDTAEKTGPTPFTIPAGATGGQPDLLAYTPGNAVITPQPTSSTDPEKGVVTTVTYPPNTYSTPGAYTPSASGNPYTIYSPPVDLLHHPHLPSSNPGTRRASYGGLFP
ncbi:hypothetical protein CPB86DRAFT_826701 [Serendipita vermifera]|nr:hypothetical protein CPB86DRAFT_826701 [Serendipita vermifera]